MKNQYPLSGIAALLASRGREGDSMIVHMNPVEVAGIAALSPKGLTVNPDTGQLEAFNFMESVLPMVGAAAMVAATGGVMAAPLAAGLGSGLTTAAVTGDLERGAISGVMGAAGGAAMGAAGGVGADAAAGIGGEVAGEVAAEAVTPAITDALAPELAAQAVPLQQAGGDALLNFGNQQAVGVVPEMSMGDKAAAAAGDFIKPNDPNSAYNEMGFADRMKTPFTAKTPEGGSAMMSEVMKSRTMLPLAMGASMYGQAGANSDADKAGREAEAKRKGDLKGAYNDLQGAYRAAQPGIGTGYSPYRSQMSNRSPLPEGYARGGQTKFESGGGSFTGRMKGRPSRMDLTVTESYAAGGPTYSRIQTEVADRERDGGRGYNIYTGGSRGGGSRGYEGPSGYDGIDPVAVQAGLRGAHSVAPPADYRPGFDPEFDYFQDDPQNIQVPPRTPPQQYRELQRMQQPTDPYFKNILPPPEGSEAARPPVKLPGGITVPPNARIMPIKDDGMAAGGHTGQGQNSYGYAYADGGQVGMATPMGNVSVPDSGIARLPAEGAPPQGMPPQGMPPQGGPAAMPEQADVENLAAALMGQAGGSADQIIEGFVQKYGPQLFQMLRDMILKQGNPNAQTEGMVQGQGGGMDDQVPGTIGQDQPVAVSPGEYIVPADVVSGLGDGSSDAGAAELDRMGADTRMARGGTTTQPPPFDAQRVMPR